MLLRQVEVNGEIRPYVEQVTWMGLIGAVHLPATVAPVGSTPEGLPVGVQIVAPHLEDRTSIEFARSCAPRWAATSLPRVRFPKWRWLR